MESLQKHLRQWKDSLEINKMKDIAIVGKGGLGREVHLLIKQINDVDSLWNFVGYFDDDKDTPLDGAPYLGDLKKINTIEEPLCIAFGIGNSSIRKLLRENITNELVSFPNLFHPNLIYDSMSFRNGIGNIVFANNVISTNTEIADFVIVNLGSTIGHDVNIDSYSTINPGVNVSGNVSIKDLTLIGTGSCIIQGLTIGNNAVVGAGAVVLRNVDNHHTVIGNPARPIRTNL